MIESTVTIGAFAAANRVKAALTLLDKTEWSLGGPGAPAAPRPPAPPSLPFTPGLDFPSLIAARLVLAARSKPVPAKNPDGRFKKRG
jgi:hypothetical protein